MTDAVLEVRGLAKRYGPVEALKGIAGLLTGLWAKRRVAAPVAPVPAGEGVRG